MKAATTRSLKSLNMVWLVSVALVDLFIVVALVAPEWLQAESLTRAGIGRVAASIAMPTLVLLMVNLLPHDVKAMLVYWKPLGNLPGSQAFTKHGPSDRRIDMGALKRNVGVLPKDPNEQNAKWYKLYRQVSSETEVAEAHRLFLLYRDMAAVSLLLGMTVPLGLLYAGTSIPAVAGTAALFLVQYLATAVGARWSGVRFVCSVLAVHSAKKVTASKAATTS
ncbi:hypothetical protein [Acidovorax sp.]|uniref:hypothetical protein n=1 Tax=Acidovorax sp. TaxID=1872122 RepID=UPI0025BF946E|nr:hypothetical protein [Acidovorax sp.]MCI5069060.1 hypothetical protein [Acidovorax sp.]